MTTVDLTDALKCPICGTTTGKTGKPFTKSSQVRGHVVFAHSDKLVKAAAEVGELSPEPPDEKPADPPKRRTFSDIWFDQGLP